MSSVREHPPVAVFGPDPLLSIAIEAGGEGDEVHVHAAGQGVWVTRMAAELGASTVLCGMAGGEAGAVLRSLLAALPGERRITETAASSGSYVVDRRGGERRVLAASLRPAPRRHEVDDLMAATCATAFTSAVLVMCNPYPGDGFPEAAYETVAADVAAAGVPVIVDLSSPRLERTLAALGAAAGSANFLRHGLGTGKRAVVEQLTQRITVRPLDGVVEPHPTS